jgi:hypothetical protein
MRKIAVHTAVVSAVIAGAAGWAILTATSPGQARSSRIFAQKLVEDMLAKHSEVTGLEISVVTKAGCKTIAATDPKDLGEKCDEDELRPLETGDPFVEREKDGFDVTLPLHDGNGKIIAAVGMDFKPAAGQTKESVVKQGQQIVVEMESQVPSKDKLFEGEIRFSAGDFENHAELPST